ncbi:MAG TPA: GNAT family N-acetyltransferase [Roseiflexaceae bacterium]
MSVIIRPAVAEDQYAIKAIVRAALINPTSLAWPRFLVATWGQDTIGVGQVKPHGDGSRELASIAVVPEWQGQGVGGAIIRGLLARETGPLHLTCVADKEGYYARFGFRRIPRAEMTPYFRRLDRVARLIGLLLARDMRLIVMRRDASPRSQESGVRSQEPFRGNL